ncbi:hypothetical protein ACKVV7_009867 [Pyricularia oryzae]
MSSGSGSSSSSPTKARHQLRPPHPNGHLHRSSRPHSRTSSPNPPPSPRLHPLPPPLLLTIRFSNGLPDLHLDIQRPTTTPVIALKHLIRSRLEEPTSQRRLRFINAGRILPDDAALSAVLKPLPALPPPPPPASGKGKAVEGAAPAPPRVYVNCSIGDLLTDKELAAEAEAATVKMNTAPSSPTGPLSPSPFSSTGERTGLLLDASHGAGGQQQQQQQRGPRGFDRLLSAGFSHAEVNQLRLQFRSIQSSRHTPDTMPSPDTLRSMEDAWMDNNQGTGGGGGGMGSYGGGGDADGLAGADGGDEVGINGFVDVMLRGMLIGFVWPLGAFGWLVREEGLYSRRWKVFISFGCLLSLIIGLIRSISGEHA